MIVKLQTSQMFVSSSSGVVWAIGPSRLIQPQHANKLRARHQTRVPSQGESQRAATGHIMHCTAPFSGQFQGGEWVNYINVSTCVQLQTGVSINDCLTISILFTRITVVVGWCEQRTRISLVAVHRLETFREFITKLLWRSAAGDRYAECLYCPGLMFISAFYGAGLVFELNGAW